MRYGAEQRRLDARRRHRWVSLYTARVAVSDERAIRFYAPSRTIIAIYCVTVTNRTVQLTGSCPRTHLGFLSSYKPYQLGIMVSVEYE